MSSITLPVRVGLAQQFFSTLLDEVTFRIDLAWNQREGAWYMDITDADDTVIRQGIKVMLGVPLLRKESTIGRPLGEIIAIDTSGANEEAGLDDLGDRVQLIYREAD